MIVASQPLHEPLDCTIVTTVQRFYVDDMLPCLVKYYLSLFIVPAQLLSEPQDCLMGMQGCTEGLGGWTLGLTGQCYNPQAGFRIGKNANRMASLQVLLCVLESPAYPSPIELRLFLFSIFGIKETRNCVSSIRVQASFVKSLRAKNITIHFIRRKEVDLQK